MILDREELAARYTLLAPGVHSVTIESIKRRPSKVRPGAFNDVVTVTDDAGRTAVATFDQDDSSTWGRKGYLYKAVGAPADVSLVEDSTHFVGKRVDVDIAHSKEGWANVRKFITPE